MCLISNIRILCIIYNEHCEELIAILMSLCNSFSYWFTVLHSNSFWRILNSIVVTSSSSPWSCHPSASLTCSLHRCFRYIGYLIEIVFDYRLYKLHVFTSFKTLCNLSPFEIILHNLTIYQYCIWTTFVMPFLKMVLYMYFIVSLYKMFVS